jgi:hypothetical protein
MDRILDIAGNRSCEKYKVREENANVSSTVSFAVDRFGMIFAEREREREREREVIRQLRNRAYIAQKNRTYIQTPPVITIGGGLFLCSMRREKANIVTEQQNLSKKLLRYTKKSSSYTKKSFCYTKKLLRYTKKSSSYMKKSLSYMKKSFRYTKKLLRYMKKSSSYTRKSFRYTKKSSSYMKKSFSYMRESCIRAVIPENQKYLKHYIKESKLITLKTFQT